MRGYRRDAATLETESPPVRGLRSADVGESLWRRERKILRASGRAMRCLSRHGERGEREALVAPSNDIEFSGERSESAATTG